MVAGSPDMKAAGLKISKTTFGDALKYLLVVQRSLLLFFFFTFSLCLGNMRNQWVIGPISIPHNRTIIFRLIFKTNVLLFKACLCMMFFLDYNHAIHLFWFTRLLTASWQIIRIIIYWIYGCFIFFAIGHPSDRYNSLHEGSQIWDRSDRTGVVESNSDKSLTWKQ